MSIPTDINKLVAGDVVTDGPVFADGPLRGAIECVVPRYDGYVEVVIDGVHYLLMPRERVTCLYSFGRAWAEAQWAQAQGMHYCPNCRAYFDVVRRARAEHLCTVWDGPACTTPGCNEPTVFVTVAAPGTGKGYSCRAGHYVGTCRVLEPWEVV